MAKRQTDLLEINRHLLVLFETYNRVGSEESFKGYRDALKGMTSEDMAIAFPAAMRKGRAGFMPTPGEILQALDLEKEANAPMKRKRLANPHCPDCQGSGFVSVPFVSDVPDVAQRYQQVKPCKCWKAA